MGQYNRNTEILKSFFSKPLTLVISILFFVSAIIPNLYMIVKMVSSGVYDSAVLCAYSLLLILPAFAFLNLFIQGRKALAVNRLNTPLILIYMYTALSVLVPVGFSAYLVYSYSVNENELAFWLFSALLVVLIIPVLILIVLEFVSTLITLHSIRKSANGIYLCRKGSVFMGVTSFLSASSVILITLYFIDTTSYSRILDYSSMFDSVMLLSESAVLAALFVCLGIWSLMYSKAIKKAAVYLYGTDKKANDKVFTLADDVKRSDDVFVHNPNYYVEQNQLDDIAVPCDESENPRNPDISPLPLQDENSIDDIVVHTPDYPDNINTYDNTEPSDEPIIYKETVAFSPPTQNSNRFEDIVVHNPYYFTEQNPYKKKKAAKVRKRRRRDEVTNHINFQNPYENFAPQNPFSNNNDK